MNAITQQESSKTFSQRIQEANPRDLPMTETGYYAWLKAGKRTDVHAHDTKKEYLTECFGFVVGINHITVFTVETLNYIENYYFDTVVAPTLKLEFKDNV